MSTVGSEDLKHCWMQLPNGRQCGGTNCMEIVPENIQAPMRLPTREELRQRALQKGVQFRPGQHVRQAIDETRKELRDAWKPSTRKDFEG
jgi:hypothetical protein